MDDILEIEHNIVKALRNVYDPEIPVNIYDLGLIYEIEVDENGKAFITMTLTAPNCPMADQLIEDVHEQVSDVPGVTDVAINLTFDPPWDQSILSDEAKLELGLL
ncbi:MAG: iron-sulfur cluster assembly protein [Prevotellaceae bacterium]|jgi:FeS assembly SUF system protein|nr:iron-sulfur cluster assembly protein [Prevotellaceae bacterium]